MFDIEMEIDREEKKHSDTIEMINKCKGIEDLVSCVGICCIYMQDTDSWDDCKAALERVAKMFGKYKIFNYFLTCTNDRLCVTYSFGSLLIHFYCKDVETALNSVGQGRCKIEETTETKKQVVCNAN